MDQALRGLNNEIHQAKNLRVKYDTTVCHTIKEGTVQAIKREAPIGCLDSKDSQTPAKRVKFDLSIVIARCELLSWRASNN